MSALSIAPSMAGAAAVAVAPSADPDYPAAAWYGNIQYLLNISAAGAASCLLLFLLVKLRSDHRRFPGPSALAAKLLAVYHATPAQIALHCGADAAQFLLIERASFFVLLAVALLALIAALPLNLCAGSVPLADPFARTTISHLRPGSPFIWLHLLLAALVVAVAHLGITRMEDDLRITRFRDGNGNPSDPNSSSIAIFTMMVQGIPKALAADKARSRSTFSIDILERSTALSVQNDISWLEARLNARSLSNDGDEGIQIDEHLWLRKAKEFWAMVAAKLGMDGRPAPELHSWSLKTDFRSERKKRPIGQFFPLMELQLERSRWRVERAPPAEDIYWNHLGLSKLSLRLRKIASWLTWLEGSSWVGALVLQFLPNVLIFVSMYIIIPCIAEDGLLLLGEPHSLARNGGVIA
ncbi:hypothetical protein MUK42_29852 [Musa troglodytarum]|uniref:CSC1/OSCA1-like N-terminal transmembrane domain-containing protein n=1 Tax=Musa troglodytarum TaxID=320322 RepID=A0A9E7FH72_9LILI|nr:hypothetical protein MUK42_29852 [Musa troglodytarum]